VEVNGVALGLSKSEIADRMGDITAFAELEEFMQTPVRYYSSGMMARLGFAVAAHTTPDLLLVDEVLAVGDHAFQKKCLDRIQALRESGTTILLVSHDADTIAKQCERALWLHDGALRRDGDPKSVMAEYLKVCG
jgi:ABC-type polysaccharide/polyol phosphate transport system ATPase subunit